MLKTMRGLLLTLTALSVLACSPSGRPADATPAGAPAPAATKPTSAELYPQTDTDPVVAIFGERSLRLSELDQNLQIRKHDLAWALYELRLQSLYSLLDAHAASNTDLNTDLNADQHKVQITLTPPAAPRLNIPVNGRTHIGATEAPIKLAVFCSYQSAPCARLQPVLASLHGTYAERLAIVPFDLPMDFHRNARSAANAARCAAEQGEFAAFQQGLYADINALTVERFLRLAQQLGLNVDALLRCYETGTYDDAIAQDIAFGIGLNAGNVPLVFINGLYTKGTATHETYARVIDAELRRLGVAMPVTLPLSNPADNTDERAAAQPDTSHASEAQQPLAPAATTTLSRSWLNAQLLNQTELASHFQNAEHRVNNEFYLLRLNDIADNEFFATLGLQDRDVIMQVNGQWLHSGQMPIWEELYSQDRVSLIGMRKGLPYRYDFVIE